MNHGLISGERFLLFSVLGIGAPINFDSNKLNNVISPVRQKRLTLELIYKNAFYNHTLERYNNSTKWIPENFSGNVLAILQTKRKRNRCVFK